ncbi:unnamed protein product [Soboliphyme baturini]|uniref:Deoxyribonuclease II n=1 Tax=Soboliphyme baturini TaxID=241478 RepID=A0A183IWR6_9BILA|nr:unnamed protein product [Soboliphyme baturini]
MSSHIGTKREGKYDKNIYTDFSNSIFSNNVWFRYIVYKLPQQQGSQYNTVRNGTAYLYMDSKDHEWRFSGKSLSFTDNSLAHTLSQVYKHEYSNDVFYFFYNDQVGKMSPKVGHTKGVVAFDEELGFWLIHSVPHFPPHKKYAWPRSATIFGQSALCVTFPIDQLLDISYQLYLNSPGIYGSNLPASFATRFPYLAKALRAVRKTSPPYENSVVLRSKDGENFVSFAKSGKWHKELYTDYVSKVLKTSLLTETWRNGQGNMHSNCSSQYRVLDVKDIQLTDGIYFPTTRDHSKWAVSTSDKSWVCIGDINRQARNANHGQLRRGGGTMCIHNDDVWSHYYNAIKSYEKCAVKREDAPQPTNDQSSSGPKLA